MKIAIIPNISKASYISVVDLLVKAVDGRALLIAEEAVAHELSGVVPSTNLYDEADIAIVIGGDGSILMAAIKCAKYNIPILGINLGRIGFMSEVETADIKGAVDRLIDGNYTSEKRMMMDINLVKKNGEGIHKIALNDAVITKSAEAKLISLDLFSNGDKVSEYVADGLIIATPTGSTGYNISAGGPVIDPVMELFSATSICPHMLNARPMIMPTENVSIRLNDKLEENSALLTVDGEVCGTVDKGDVVNITKSELFTTLIKMGSMSFYDVLMNKLS